MQVVELPMKTQPHPKYRQESCYLKAQVHHATGIVSDAKLIYTEACHLWPQFPPPQYRMVQMLVNEDSIEGNVLEGPLYKMIHKTRVAKDNVSIVLILHEKQVTS